MYECCSLITCRLVDKHGNMISPYAPGAITYTALLNSDANHWSVSIEGYIAIYSGDERISTPIPFCINTIFSLFVPNTSTVTFKVESFHAWAATCQHKCTPGIGKIKLLLSIETVVSSRKTSSIMVPQVDSDLKVIDCIDINTVQICDSTRIHSESCTYYKNAELQAEICQYNTIADGLKRTFLNSDEMKKYGGCGILSPKEVSYYNVFVNGILQPKKNYILKKGELTFTTQDIPSKDQTVIILFVTWKDINDHIMDSIQWQYNAISDGSKKIYVNGDEIPGYENQGIPSPSKVSFFNLYINGVLQPRVSYCIRKGMLELITNNAPTKGSLVILESVIIRDSKGRLLRIESFDYNAYSYGGKIYTNQDGIRMYNMDGILDPDKSSYQNLFINGILQPHVNYRVMGECLILETEDSPTVKAPITLQSVNSPPAAPCCRIQMSDAALAQLKKVFHNIRDNDDIVNFDDFDGLTEKPDGNNSKRHP